MAGPAPQGLSNQEARGARDTIHRYANHSYRYDIVPDIIADVMYTDIIPDIIPDVTQEGLLPRLDAEASGLSQAVKQFRRHTSPSTLSMQAIARAINDLINAVLKNPAFNADEVDTDMLERLQASIDSGGMIEIINLHVEGDSKQVLDLFKRPVEKVLQVLISEIRLAGCQHCAYQEYKDQRGNRLFAGHSSGSVSFQLA